MTVWPINQQGEPWIQYVYKQPDHVHARNGVLTLELGI